MELFHNKDKFEDTFDRIVVDLHNNSLLCGNYEKETIEMLKNAFKISEKKHIMFKDGQTVTKSEIINADWEVVNRNSFLKSITYENQNHTLGVTFYDESIGHIFRIDD